MKPLSQSLEELAGRTKELEDSATATIDASRAELEKRRQEINASLDAERHDFETALDDAARAGREWWEETRAAMKRPLDELRQRVETRKAEHEVHKAARMADAAEEDAAAAVELADYWLNVAEYAVVDAALARMNADDLADKQPAAPASSGS